MRTGLDFFLKDGNAIDSGADPGRDLAADGVGRLLGKHIEEIRPRTDWLWRRIRLLRARRFGPDGNVEVELRLVRCTATQERSSDDGRQKVSTPAHSRDPRDG